MIHDVLFPTGISIGATGGPEFLTRVTTTGSGHEYRNASWAHARGKWTVTQAVKIEEEKDELITFFRARRGKWAGFRLKDPFDHYAVETVFGTGDGALVNFQLGKTYDDGIVSVIRTIVFPVDNSVYTDADPVVIYVNGAEETGVTINYANGLVTFDTAPAADAVLSWTGEFHVPARFDNDHLNGLLTSNVIYDFQDINLVELRPEEVIEAV
jgi:uncharacterized protein (TIGR02217 family)